VLEAVALDVAGPLAVPVPLAAAVLRKALCRGAQTRSGLATFRCWSLASTFARLPIFTSSQRALHSVSVLLWCFW
jgi:hypothetical protein